MGTKVYYMGKMRTSFRYLLQRVLSYSIQYIIVLYDSICVHHENLLRNKYICIRRYRNPNHHSGFKISIVMRRNEKKLYFASHLGFGWSFLSDCLSLEPELFRRPLPSNWYLKRNRCINLK